MDDLGELMASEGERVSPVFMVTFDFCLICWSLGRCSFHLDSMALLGFRTNHFGCSNSYSYFSQLCQAWSSLWLTVLPSLSHPQPRRFLAE